MSLTNVPGADLWIPAPFVGSSLNGNPGLSSQTIDATGEKVAFVGQVYFPDRSASSRNLSRVQFLFGTVTKAGGSALTVSTQDVSTSSGPVIQPDGTQDQTVAIANADASFASNTWYRTGTFSASRTVNHGDWLAIVIEYDGSGRLSSDTVSISSTDYFYGGRSNQFSLSLLYTTSWAVGAAGPGIPNLVLEFDDGSFGALGICDPAKTITSVSYNTSTGGADEYGRVINLPFPCKISGVWASGKTASSTVDVDLKLYTGTTLTATASVDGNQLDNVNNFIVRYFSAPQTLAANTDYVIAFSPNSASNVTLNYFTVDSNSLLAVSALGINGHMVKRLDAGSWTDDTTSVPYMGIIISAVDDGAGGSGPVGQARIIQGIGTY